MTSLIIALALTITLEFLIAWALLRRTPLKLFIYSVLINCFTLPIAIYIYTHYQPQDSYHSQHLLLYFSLEFIVFAVEIPLWWLLTKIKLPKAIILSFLANLVTSLIGKFI